jgi:hypothetical protein
MNSFRDKIYELEVKHTQIKEKSVKAFHQCLSAYLKLKSWDIDMRRKFDVFSRNSSCVVVSQYNLI